MRSLLLPGLPTLHDSNPHIARAIAYHTAVMDGEFPPTWAKEVLGGIGSPVLMLNYQLPYMIGEIWHQAGLSYVASYKLTLGLSFVLSGVLMYLALTRLASPLAAWVGALLYSLAPYRFLDIYVRGALGEAVAFVFAPVVLSGVLRSSFPLLTIGWTGLFLTHPLAAAIFSGVFLGYVGLFHRTIKELKVHFLAYLLALAIASFNLLPTLSLTQYTYYSPELSNTLTQFPTLAQLFHSPWGYGNSVAGTDDQMSFSLGLVQWLVLLAGIVICFAAQKFRGKLGYILAVTCLTIFLMLPSARILYIWLNLTMIIDFPWRLLMCLTFASAWVGTLLMDTMRNRTMQKLAAGAVFFSLIFLSAPIAKTNTYWDRDEMSFARETGDSYGEYAPRTRETQDSSPFGERAEFIEGTGVITPLVQKSNRQSYQITSEQGGIVRINTAYFPGWQMDSHCFVTQRTLSHIDDSGLMACPVVAGTQTVTVVYEAPIVVRTGNLISLAGIGIFIWYIFRSYYPRSTKLKR